ncbi:MAG: hypothetical protein NW223_23635 [Hyphomicrobiaceae bacterium]|nr:hypothetical protein [Hyphomicrobiaceae bacterium]
MAVVDLKDQRTSILERLEAMEKRVAELERMALHQQVAILHHAEVVQSWLEAGAIFGAISAELRAQGARLEAVEAQQARGCQLRTEIASP